MIETGAIAFTVAAAFAVSAVVSERAAARWHATSLKEREEASHYAPGQHRARS